MGVGRVRAQLPAPLPLVWEFIIDPRNLHHWGPFTKPVTGVDRPLQPGDRMTTWRKDFFRRHSQELLIEEVVPYRSFRMRVLSPGGRRMDVTATITVWEAEGPGATWIEEAIAYSLGEGRAARWVDRWLVNPLLQVMMRWKTSRAFRRLGRLLAR
jgi:ligand-binding SRPBCC domain-containing protein